MLYSFWYVQYLKDSKVFNESFFDDESGDDFKGINIF